MKKCVLLKTERRIRNLSMKDLRQASAGDGGACYPNDGNEAGIRLTLPDLDLRP